MNKTNKSLRLCDSAAEVNESESPGTPEPATSAAGFTLLELLVVLVIIGIVSSFAVMSTGMSDRDKPLGKETQRLLALLQMASEEAVQQGEELGMRIGSDSYHFVRYEEGAWQPLEDELFRERSLPENLAVELELEGRPIVLDDPAKSADESEETEQDEDKKEPPQPPQIVFLSSGEVSPFALTLSEHPGTGLQVIKSAGDGLFTLDDGKESER